MYNFVIVPQREPIDPTFRTSRTKRILQPELSPKPTRPRQTTSHSAFRSTCPQSAVHADALPSWPGISRRQTPAAIVRRITCNPPPGNVHANASPPPNWSSASARRLRTLENPIRTILRARSPWSIAHTPCIRFSFDPYATHSPPRFRRIGILSQNTPSSPVFCGCAAIRGRKHDGERTRSSFDARFPSSAKSHHFLPPVFCGIAVKNVPGVENFHPKAPREDSFAALRKARPSFSP